MFGEPETIYLTPETAHDFGLIKNKPTKKRDAVSYLPNTINEQDGKITIVGKIDGTEQSLIYSAEALSKKERIFIAWVYLLLEDYKTKENTRALAEKYLFEALKEDLDFFTAQPEKNKWAFPYYLISKHGLKVQGIVDIRTKLYQFIKTPQPLFLDFYREILRQEKNPIRKVHLAKIAEKYYPTDPWFTGEIADDLFSQKKYAECIKYILSVKKRFKKAKEWQDTNIRLTLIKTYIKSKKYAEAIEELKKPIIDTFWSSEYTPLLRGVVFCHQKNWKEAEKNLEMAIFSDVSDINNSPLATYYLIRCYIATKNQAKLEKIIFSYVLQEDELFLDQIPFEYGEDALDILKQAVQSSVVSKRALAKLKGMLAYLIYKMLPLTDRHTGTKRKPTSEEKAEIDYAIALVKNALEFYPDERFFNALCSNLHYEKKMFDRAMDYKLRNLAGKSENVSTIYPEVELSQCSTKYLLKYPDRVVEIFSELDAGPKTYLEGYDFDADVGALWSKKFYKQLASLYKYLEPAITDYKKIGELGDLMKGGGLFELAYALYEVGDLDTSKKVYEKHAEINGETSSVLNNLSLIYEKKRDFKKAKELIIRAKKLDKDGEIVARNYSRLVSAAKNDNPEKTKPESPKIVKSIPSFDPRNGIVKLGDKQTEIPLGSNQYQLCKKLFEIPLGDWLQETDVIDHFNRGKDSGRSFYDAIRLANQKIEDDLKVKKLLEYQASRVRVRKEGIA